MNLKRWGCLLLFFCLLAGGALGEEVIPPAYPVPEYVTWLLEVANEEVGYTEGDHGWSKYGEWAGDPYCQWCAEFLCWCVNQVDERHGTSLLKNVYPLYSGSNGGKKWYVKQGRYLVRWGNLDGWGYQWLKGSDHFVTTGEYIPQPGDWVFFTWTDGYDTDHVAMVEYCTQDESGAVTIHVIEGNAPSAVARATYPLDYGRILGYGTVHDVVETTLRSGNVGEEVREVQAQLAYLQLLPPDKVDGVFGSGTVNAVKTFQTQHGLKAHGIVNMDTRRTIRLAVELAQGRDPATWLVVDEDD